MSGLKDLVELPKPVDVRSALAEIAKELHEVGGDFALIGGVALALYGIERYTKDVDVAVSMQQSAALERRLPNGDPRPLSIGGVSIRTSSGVRVDLIDRRFHYEALFLEAIQAAKASSLRTLAGEVEVPVVPVPYLLAMKVAADRPQDEADVQLLLKDPALDYRAARDVVKRFIGHYAARRLDRAARANGRSDAPQEYEDD